MNQAIRSLFEHFSSMQKRIFAVKNNYFSAKLPPADKNVNLFWGEGDISADCFALDNSRPYITVEMASPIGYKITQYYHMCYS